MKEREKGRIERKKERKKDQQREHIAYSFSSEGAGFWHVFI